MNHNLTSPDMSKSEKNWLDYTFDSLAYIEQKSSRETDLAEDVLVNNLHVILRLPYNNNQLSIHPDPKYLY
jgi:hypothetical protein